MFLEKFGSTIEGLGTGIFLVMLSISVVIPKYVQSILLLLVQRQLSILKTLLLEYTGITILTVIDLWYDTYYKRD